MESTRILRSSRREQAAATRQRIVEAAHAAFLHDGYAATPMTAVAEDAGVAVQTVYFVFRTKGDLLHAVYEHVVLGPERTPPHLTSWWRDVEQEPDIRVAVRTLVQGTATLLERAAPLVHMVLGDETAKESYELNERLRREGNEVMVRLLSDKHPLRSDLSPSRALDQLLVLTGPQLYTQLTNDMAWTHGELEEWMTSAVLHHVFGL